MNDHGEVSCTTTTTSTSTSTPRRYGRRDWSQLSVLGDEKTIVKRSTISGIGVGLFTGANTTYTKGMIICEFTGDLISKSTAQAIRLANTGHHSHFITLDSDNVI